MKAVKAVVIVIGTSRENDVEHEFSDVREAREFYKQLLAQGYEAEFHRM